MGHKQIFGKVKNNRRRMEKTSKQQDDGDLSKEGQPHI